jgi:hypothetical protein
MTLTLLSTKGELIDIWWFDETRAAGLDWGIAGYLIV